MMKLYLVFACVLACSCVTQPSAPPTSSQSELLAESSVTVKDPSFNPEAGDSIAWLQSLTWVGLNADADVAEWTDFIQANINKQFTQKGYQVKEDSDDYQILAFIVMGELSDHPDIQALFRLYPDVGASAEGREHGTLILSVLPRHGSDMVGVKTAWRGAVQIFQALNNELEPGQTQERVAMAIEHLMRTIPDIQTP